MRAGVEKPAPETIYSGSDMKFEHTYDSFRWKQRRQSHSLHLGGFTVEGEIKVIIYSPHKRQPAAQKVRDRSRADIAQELGRLPPRRTGAKLQTTETERRLEPEFLHMELKLHATDRLRD